MSQAAALEVASLSHPGMVRSHNEDSVFVDGEAGIAMLADGMGGYNAGEVASGIAVNVVSQRDDARAAARAASSPRSTSPSGLTHGALLLQQQIASANKGIYEAAQARPECAGMGTTIVAAVFCGNRVSHRPHRRLALLSPARREVRAAHARPFAAAGADRQRRAHARAGDAIRSTRIWSRARSASRRSYPTDIAEYRIEANDIYLLCSDGLTDMVDGDVIHSVVDEKRSDLALAAADLIDLANQNGGRDNISVVLVRVPPEFLPVAGWAQRWLAKKKG